MASIFVSNGWILQNPYFFGHSGLMAYLPAATSTLGPDASPDGNLSERLFKRIAQRLAPSTARDSTQPSSCAAP